MAQVAAATLIGLALVACGGSKSDEKPPTPRDKVIEAWQQANLSPSAFVAAPSTVGSDCAAGMVGSLDVMLCNFPSAAAAQAAEEPGRGWVGMTTGTAVAKGNVLVAIADRKKADPSGKLINQLMKLAPVPPPESK
jgi:hypothetical protein